MSTATSTVVEPPASRFSRFSSLPGGRRGIGAAALVLLVLAAGTAVGVTRTATPAVSAHTPVVLPGTLQGLAVVPGNDLLRSPEWRAAADQALGGVAYGAATYATAGTTLTMRVVAARTDLTGRLDQTWAVDRGTTVGPVTCTQNVRPVKGGRSGVRPTVMLCWRTSSTLSAYALSIDPKHPITSSELTAAVVNDAWAAAQGG